MLGSFERSRWLALALVLPWLVAGCGGNSLPEESNADAACAALRTALDAWKNGEDLEGLKELDPPVYFKDMSLMQGAKLESYTLDSKTEQLGLSVICTATLTVLDESGKSKQRTATYQIDTHDAIVIVPGDG